MHKLPDCTLPYEHHNSQSPHHPCIPVQMVRKQHSTGTLSPPCLCSNEKHHILIKIPVSVCVCACSFENMFINILLYVCVCVCVCLWCEGGKKDSHEYITLCFFSSKTRYRKVSYTQMCYYEMVASEK